MISMASLCVLASWVPSPGQSVLQSASVEAYHAVLLAQVDTESGHPDPAAEEELEEDMREAREHLGHDHAHPEDHEPTSEQTDRVERYRYEVYEEDEAWPAPAPGPHRPVVLRDGHGKGHYLGWGIADWAIAGGLWVGSLSFALNASYFVYLASGPNRHYYWEGGRAEVDRDVFLGLAIGCGVAALVSAGLGALFGVKASHNLVTYREMRAEEVALRGY